VVAPLSVRFRSRRVGHGYNFDESLLEDCVGAKRKNRKCKLQTTTTTTTCVRDDDDDDDGIRR
jgi:hypothetical protein